MSQRLNTCCIVIPLYKNVHSILEVRCLRHNLSVLKDWPVVFAVPENYHPQPEIVEILAKNPRAEVQRLKSSFFSSIVGYNELMVSYNFYRNFSNFDYILICQLDVIIFSDELRYWMGLNYSYIGAPWIEMKDGLYSFSGVGNGGLSLRKINDFRATLERFNSLNYAKALCKKLLAKPSLFMALSCINRYFRLHGTERFTAFGNEDYFWGVYARIIFNGFTVAPAIDALNFAFELYPSQSFKLNGFKLPMGTHAWERYEAKFWRQHLPPAIKELVVQS